MSHPVLTDAESLFSAAAAKKPEPRSIPLPRLGFSILLRWMTAKEKDAFEDSLSVQKGKKTERNLRNFRARLISEVAVKADGSKLFSPAQAEQLGDLCLSDVEPVFDAAMEMNGFTRNDLEAITKNSEAGPGAGSP